MRMVKKIYAQRLQRHPHIELRSVNSFLKMGFVLMAIDVNSHMR